MTRTQLFFKSLGRWGASVAAAAALLSGCGGGGGGSAPTTANALQASSALANVCTAEGQKAFVRSYLDEVYLWYDEIKEVDAAGYADATSYFDALLVRTPDVNGLPKDQFSAVRPASVAESLTSMDFGRPQTLQLDPSAAGSVQTVPIVKTVNSPAGRKTGYILFLDHDTGAQDALIAGFQQLRDQAVQDLVLDLRYNSGGFLYIALSAASMVAGPQSEGMVFEQLRYNKKRTAETANSYLLFSSRVQFAETTYARGTALPQLGLPRLYVLTSRLTCSASESIVNSLRGIGVQVVLIGQTTCGKPYGFHEKDNCGYAYFPIEFQGLNAQGYGDYTAGFQPACHVTGNTSTPMGDPQEPLLAAALTHIDTGACPAGTSLPSGVQLSLDPSLDPSAVARPPWAGRLLAPQR